MQSSLYLCLCWCVGLFGSFGNKKRSGGKGLEGMNRLHYDIGFGWGVAACRRKDSRVPIADSRIMDFIKENCKEAGTSVPLTKRWLDGYAFQIDQDMKAAGL